MSGNGPEPFSVAVADAGGRLLVTVRGELDLATAPQLEEALVPPLREGGAAVLDLRELEFMDSTGVRVIVAAHVAAKESGGSLALVRTDPEGPVGRVLEISGLDAILTLVDEP
ncbi:MAG TPA: STAS domain-containing protein [Baekduia sp.]